MFGVISVEIDLKTEFLLLKFSHSYFKNYSKHYLLFFYFFSENEVFNVVDYTKEVTFDAIQDLFEKNCIDPVYVRFLNEDKDRMFDCFKPTDMINLKNITEWKNEVIIGWRLHHHRREDKNVALAKRILKGDEDYQV